MTAYTILLILGSAFVLLGLVIALAFLSVSFMAPSIVRFPLLICFFFVFTGCVMLYFVFRHYRKERDARRKGTYFRGKIYALHDDNSIMINEAPAVSVEVRYFDEAGEEQSVICDTKSGARNRFPLGASVSFYLYQGVGHLVPESVDTDVLYQEDLLMDDIPPKDFRAQMVAVTCKSCGASNKFPAGFASKCPYCGTFITVETGSCT